MKRSIAVLAIAVTAAAGVYSQQSLDTFAAAFKGFASDLANTLTVDSTIGSNWSDAYIGKFPHFGVGVTAGAAFSPVASASELFTDIGSSLPSQLSSIGIPIPAVVGTLKIGLPFLPMDIGIKGGYLPTSVTSSLLSSSGITADYTNIGIQLRYAIVQQNLFLPNVSIGAAYNYQKGSIGKSMGGDKSFTIATDQSSTTTITATAPALAVGWTSNTVDFTAQVSKKLIFFIPYAGLGCSFGTTSVTGGATSTIGTNYKGGVSALNTWLAANGGPAITDQGFTYTATENTPIFRVYGGFSIRIFVVDFDAQAMYVPASQSLGATLTARVQI